MNGVPGSWDYSCNVSGDGYLGNLNENLNPAAVVGEQGNAAGNGWWTLEGQGTGTPTVPLPPSLPGTPTTPVVTPPTTPSIPNIITGVQGYNPAASSPYTDGTALVNTYLVIYGGNGNFASSGNTVTIDGTTVAASNITYQSAAQINVSLAGIPAANQNNVIVKTPTGATGTANFTISAAGGNQCSQAASQLLTAAQSVLNSILAADSPTYTAALREYTDSCGSSGAGSGGTGTGTTGSGTSAPSTPATPPSAGATASCSDTPITMAGPLTILVTASSLNVRSSPSVDAARSGSLTLSEGDTFTAVAEVTGDCVSTPGGGSDLWWESSKGNYVWAGGTSVEGNAPAGAGAAGGGSTKSSGGTPEVATTPLSGSTTQTVTSGGISYSVTYSYLPDGEVQAAVTYKGKSYVVQNYIAFGAEGIALVQANGSFMPPWSGSQADLTLEQLANQISQNVPASQNVFPGFTFQTPLYYIDDASPYYVSAPANAFGITASPNPNVPPPSLTGLYYLDQDSNGNITGVTPVNIANNGAITTGTEIAVTSPVTGPTAPTMSHDDLQNALLNTVGFQAALTLAENAGYIVEVNNSSTDSTAVIRDPKTNAVVAAVSQSND